MVLMKTNEFEEVDESMEKKETPAFTTKHNFYKDRKNWNEYANQVLHRISTSNKYTTKPILKRSERVVDENLDIHTI